MKLNRKLVLILSLVLSLALATGGTLAYLSDSDADVNVMTLGSVYIVQNEQERDANGDLIPFQNGVHAAYPAVGDIAWDDEGVEVNGVEYLVFDDGLKNVIDKIVTVTNTGKSPAYVRTIIAIEAPDGDPKNLIHVNYNGDEGLTWTKGFMVEIDGVDYYCMIVTYEDALAPKETSAPSLMQLFLGSEADNEDVAAFGDTWEVLVLSQAVQAEGFANAEAALNAGFGVLDVNTVPALFEDWANWEANGEVGSPGDKNDTNNPPVFADVEAKDTAELAALIADLEAGDEIVIGLTGTTYTTNFAIPGGVNVTLLGNGSTILQGQIASTSSTAGTLTLKNLTVKVDSNIVDSTGISQTSKSAIALWGNQTVVCENVTFDMSLASSTAITTWWDTGKGTTVVVRNCTFNCNGQRPIRATGNVTVENTTFNDPYRYAVQLTAKSSTATLLETAVVNFNNNTIVDGANGKAFVYGIQLEGADYGCNNLVINGSGNTIVDGGAGSAMYYCECGKVDHTTVVCNTEVALVHEQQ